MSDKTEAMREFDDLLKLVTLQAKEEKSDVSVPQAHNEFKRKKRKYFAARDEKSNEAFDSGPQNPPNEEYQKTKAMRTDIYETESTCKYPPPTYDIHLNHQAGSASRESKLDMPLGCFGRNLAPGKRIRVNLPNLNVPPILPIQDEKCMNDLHLLLRAYGFQVLDRKTLAYFALGNKNNVPAAAIYFCEFYKFASTAEMRFPNRAKMVDGVTEGAARHGDGTLGLYFTARNWNSDNTLASYVAREALCYFLKLVDFPILCAGFTYAVNMSSVTWRAFVPFEMAKAANYSATCIPLEPKRILFIQPTFYASVALSLFFTMISVRISKVAYVVTLDEVRSKFPYLRLPPSLVSSTRECRSLTRLSIDEQINFQFLIDE